MSFDNSHQYPNRKDRRKPHRGAKAVDPSCRNHGSCPWCEGNRLAGARRRVDEAVRKVKDYLRGDDR